LIPPFGARNWRFLNRLNRITDLKNITFSNRLNKITDLKNALKEGIKKIFARGNLKGIFCRVKQNSSTLQGIKTYLPLKL
jgi:hypothetical protein